MEKRALVARTASASDARAYSVRLAAGGAAILAGATQHARAADAAILDLLPRTKRKTFLNTLTKLSKLAEEAAERAERSARREAKREARRKRQDKQRQEKQKDKAKDAAKPARAGKKERA
jgi:hypothetical protein